MTSRLSNGVTSDSELNAWGRKNIPGFVGAIGNDEFAHIYAKMHPGQSCIINLDPHYAHGGTHWVALRISSEAPIVYYKDSFGGPPQENVIRAVELSQRGLIYGNRIMQKITQDNCGRRSAEWLRDMSNHARQGREIEHFESLET